MTFTLTQPQPNQCLRETNQEKGEVTHIGCSGTHENDKRYTWQGSWVGSFNRRSTGPPRLKRVPHVHQFLCGESKGHIMVRVSKQQKL